MKRFATRAAFAVLALLVAIQFVPVERSNPPVRAEIQVAGEVRAVLERSCFDCHSNRTRWPWYSRVAPVSWYVVRHVSHARGDLNLSEWPVHDFESQKYFLAEMKEVLEEGEMPLDSYLLVHRGARLSAAERALLLDWIDRESDLLAGL